MKPSLELSFRSLISRIHPPLPLNPRESQKLLTLLTSSFRNQLDREHPISFGEPQANPTDRHFDWVLSNPLLSSSQSAKTSSSSKAPKSGGVLATALKSLQVDSQAPLSLFNKYVAAGTATMDVAKYYLEVQLKSMTARPEKATGTAGIGGAVLNWLRASGLEEAAIFDKKLVDLLMPVLTFEGLDRRVWSWVFLSKLEGKLELQLACGHLLQKWTLAQINHGPGLNYTLKGFVSRVGRLPETVKPYARHILSFAGRTLVSRVAQYGANERISVSIYDEFVRTAGVWSYTGAYHEALLSLYHPTLPNPEKALLYAKSRQPGEIPTYNERRKNDNIHLFLKTVQVLLGQDRLTEAVWMMEFLQERFGMQPNASGSTAQSSSHGSTLQILYELLDAAKCRKLEIPAF